MSIQDGAFDFQLTRTIKYKFDGATHEATHVKLQEPGMEHIKFYSKIKQMFSRAQMDLIKDIDPDSILALQAKAGEVVETFDKTAQKIEDQYEQHYQSIKATIEGSMVVDFDQFVNTFAKMACVINPRKSVCMIDGRLAMNDTLWNNLHPDDAIEMALRWASFFVMPLEEGAKTTSEPQQESPSQPMEA